MNRGIKSISIEFTGVAGVGKTTLIQKVIEVIEERSINYNDLRFYKDSKLKRENIIPIIKIFLLTLKLKPTSFFDAKKIFKDLGRHQLLSLNKNDHDFQVFDEGIFHKTRVIRRFCKKKPLNSIMNTCFKYVDVPDVLINLSADPKTIYERRIRRNRKNDLFDYKSIEKESNDIEFEETLKDIQYKKHKLNVIEINNEKDEDLYKNATKIVDFITELR